MRVKIFILAGLFLLIAGIMPVTGQTCGDLDGNSAIDISDLVYLIEYIANGGPAPINSATADIDQCSGINNLDLAYMLHYFFSGGPLPCSYAANCVPINSGEMFISQIEGQVGPGQIEAGREIVLHFSGTNPSNDYMRMVSHGLTITSPDGLVWGTPVIAVEPEFANYPNFPILMRNTDIGSGLDSVIFLASAFSAYEGLPPNATTKVFSVTIGPFDSNDIGKTIIIDSTSFGNGGLWRWSYDGLSSYAPAWSGPYEFTIVGDPLSSINLDNISPLYTDPITGDTMLLAGTNVAFNLRLTNNYHEAILGLNNGFKVYSPDGAEWGGVVGDTIGTIGHDLFDLVFVINYFGATGYGIDSLMFGGAAYNNSGLPSGFNEVSYAINIGPIDPSYEGKTICIDSVWTPPSGYWVWQTENVAIHPAWGGPYCYEVAVSTNMLESSIDQIEYSVLEKGSNPAPTKFSIYDILGGNYNYTIGYLDPMYTINKSSGTLPDDLVLSVATKSLQDGTYSDSIEIVVPELTNSPYYIPINVTVEQASGGFVAVDHVDGEIYNGQLRTGMPITFTMRYFNHTGYNFFGLTNAFEISSPDGAQWGGITVDTTGEKGYADFNLVISLNDNHADGMNADTVYAAFIGLKEGFFDGEDVNIITITLDGLDSSDVGKTICIDSAWYPPSVVWEWGYNNGSYKPDWYGPNCYEIVYSTDPPPPPPAEGDSLIIPSAIFNSGAAMIPVMTQLSQPIKGATIPLAIPNGVVVDSISRIGLITEDWDYTLIDIKPDSGFVFVALLNSLGEIIPEDTTTLFNLYYHFFNASCAAETYISWDTTLMGNPSRQLTFSNISATPIYPGFDVARDMITVLPFVKGDVNNDGVVDVEDIINMIDYMFRGGAPCSNFNATDINGDCLGPDVADIVMLIDYQFRGGNPPECGCLVGKAVSNESFSDRVKLFAEQKENQTILTLSSEIDLKGLELTLTGNGSGIPIGSLNELNLEYGTIDNQLRVGLFDMAGLKLIKSGQYQILTLEGEYEIVSAIAADLDFNSLGVMVSAKPGELPDKYDLSQNYPNPFNPTTEIMLSLPEKTNLTLNIYNIQGQLVTTLAEGEFEAGVHRFSWSADNFASGVYLYKVISDNYTASKKMLLIK